jgi:hypothetical protein
MTTLELTRIEPTERGRATAKKLNSFREILDEVNQLLARAGDHRGRLQLHDRLVAQCAIVRAVLDHSNDNGCRRTLYSFAKALRILCDFAARGLGAVTFDATKRTVSGALMSELTEDSSAGTWVGKLEAWLKTAEFIQTYESDLLGEVYLANLLKLGTSFQEALPDEPEPEPIVDEVVENPPAGAALDLHLATAMNLRAVANSVTDVNTLLGGGYGCSDGAIRRSNAVLCRAEVLRWVLDESLSKTAQEADGLPNAAATIAVTALTARSEAGAIGVIVEPFNAGLCFVPGERNLGAAGLPAGAVWIGDFEAWRRVAAFTLSKLRMGVDSGVLLCALSDGSATALTGGSLLGRK